MLQRRARHAYEKAVKLGNKRCNPSLHLNYATALQYDQDYVACLKHLRIACMYDPNFGNAKEYSQTLSSFLENVNASVKRKG